jgi:hypothetical protein
MIKSQSLTCLAMLVSIFAIGRAVSAQAPASLDASGLSPQSADPEPNLSSSNSADGFSEGAPGAGHRMQANNLSPVTSDRAAALLSAAGNNAGSFGPSLPSPTSSPKSTGAFDGRLQGGAGRSSSLRAKMETSFGPSSASAPPSASTPSSALFTSNAPATPPLAGGANGEMTSIRVRSPAYSALQGIPPIRFDLSPAGVSALRFNVPESFFKDRTGMSERSGMRGEGSSMPASSSRARNYETPVYSFMMKHETGQKSSSSQRGMHTTNGSTAGKKSTSHGAVIDSLMGNSVHH